MLILRILGPKWFVQGWTNKKKTISNNSWLRTPQEHPFYPPTIRRSSGRTQGLTQSRQGQGLTQSRQGHGLTQSRQG